MRTAAGVLLQVALLLAGCSVQETYLADFEPIDTAPALEEIAAARQGSRVEDVAGEGNVSIPTRVYNEGGEKLPVLMTHGLQSHAGWFAQSARFIADAGHPVYAIDRRGSGLSRERRGDCDDFREMVADIRSVAEHALKRHGAQGFHLLGHCFGAIPAAAFACAHPERLQSLVLSTPGIFTLTDLGVGDKCRIFWARITGSERYIAVPLETAMFTDLERYAGFIRDDTLSLRKATASFYYEVPRARSFIRRNTERLEMPVFMAMAGMDGICDNESNVEFFHRLPSRHKLIREYPGARHILEFSRERDRFFADLGAWFRSVESRIGETHQ